MKVGILLVILACAIATAFAASGESGQNQITVRSGSECEICQWIATEIKTMLADDATEAFILSAIDEACSLLPSSVTQKCHDLVANFGPMILSSLAEEIDPTTTCTFLGLCTSHVEEQPVTNGLECEVCEWVVGVLQNYITKNTTEAEIVVILQKVCSLVPQSMKAVCQAYVETYAPLIIQKLLDGISPTTLCAQLHLCTNFADSGLIASSPIVSVGSSNGLSCSLCDIVLEALESLVSSSSTQEEIAQAVAQVCSYIPAFMQSACDDFITQYGPQIIQALLQSENPQTVCTQIGICTSLPEVAAPVEGGLECEICQLVVQYVEQMITSNSTEAQIIAAVEKVCNIVPSALRSVCSSFIESYGPALIQALVNKEPPATACASIHLCASKLAEIEAIPHPTGALQCQVCTLLVQYLEQLITSNSTEAQIIAAMQKVCSIVPSSFRGVCESFIEAYGPQVVEALINKVPPATVCKAIKLCPAAGEELLEVRGVACALCEEVLNLVEKYITEASTEAEIVAFVQNVCKLFPAAFRGACEDMIAVYGPELIELLVNKADPETFCTQVRLCATSAQLPTASGFQCPLCEWIVSEVEKVITSESTEMKIVQTVQNICNKLPGEFGQTCSDFVATYGPYLIDLLIQKADPSMICGKIGLCKSQEVLVPEPPSDDNGLQCALCQWVMSEIESYISSNSTQQEIVNALNNVCNHLPATFKTVCSSFVDTYASAIVQLLLDRVSPQEICTHIKLCSATPAIEVPEGTVCAACEWVMSMVENFLLEDRTQTQIIQFLSNACRLLPSSLSQQCSVLLDQYGPTIIQMILDKESPDVICAQLKLCGQKVPELVDQEATKCVICQYVAGKVYGFLSQPATEEQVAKALVNVCKILPTGTARIACESLLDSWGADLVAYIVAKEQPDVICKQLRACPAA